MCRWDLGGRFPLHFHSIRVDQRLMKWRLDPFSKSSTWNRMLSRLANGWIAKQSSKSFNSLHYSAWSTHMLSGRNGRRRIYFQHQTTRSRSQIQDLTIISSSMRRMWVLFKELVRYEESRGGDWVVLFPLLSLSRLYTKYQMRTCWTTYSATWTYLMASSVISKDLHPIDLWLDW